MFDIPASTLRYWEKHFKVLAPKKNASGYRQYSLMDIDNLKMIYNLVKERGMTIEGADAQMKAQRMSVRRQVGAIELLQQVRGTLMALRDELDASGNKSETQIVIPDDGAEKPRYIEHTLFDLDSLT